MASDYQERLGRRLRAIRQQKDMTLQEVEEASDGTWKAVVIGAYERGDRAISAAKLADLASFYAVPVSELLPEDDDTVETVPLEGGDLPQITLDLTKLEDETLTPSLRPISRYATTIQRQRGDYNGRMLTLRRDDVRALAVVFGVSADDLVDRMSSAGVLAGV